MTRDRLLIWITDRTTRPIILALGLPIRYKWVYTPFIPFMPLQVLWLFIGVIVIAVFGGIALLIGQADELIEIWIPK